MAEEDDTLISLGLSSESEAELNPMSMMQHLERMEAMKMETARLQLKVSNKQLLGWIIAGAASALFLVSSLLSFTTAIIQ